MLTYTINPLIVPSVTVRLRTKSSKTKHKTSHYDRYNRGSRYTLEQCWQWEELKTVLRPCWQCPHKRPDLLNWHCELGVEKLRCDEWGRQ